MGRVKHLIAALLIIGMGLAFLVHFTIIGYYGSVTISEPREWVFYLEFFGLVIITGYGFIYLKVK